MVGRVLPSLKVRNITFLLAPSHSSLLADDTLVVQIDFVSDDDEGEVVWIARSSLRFTVSKKRKEEQYDELTVINVVHE